MTEKLKFPMVWDKCPVCGSKERIAGAIAEEEKGKGKMRKEAYAGSSIAQTLIADPTRAFLSAPLLLTAYDVCADCGAVYCVMAQVSDFQPGTAPLKMQGGGFPPAPGSGPFGFPGNNPKGG